MMRRPSSLSQKTDSTDKKTRREGRGEFTAAWGIGPVRGQYDVTLFRRFDVN